MNTGDISLNRALTTVSELSPGTYGRVIIQKGTVRLADISQFLRITQISQSLVDPVVTN